MDDPFDLQRFVDAQNRVYESVCAELHAGKKNSHWMWFIFPQIKGLGHSEMARAYAVSSLAEAQAYLRHPLLGPRLRECSSLVAAIEDRTIADIFGYPDDLKFHSSMTLFAQATPDNDIFKTCLQKYFAGKMDSPTLAQLAT
jgi:uncharacterized protein (DUF1810 family)